MPRRTSVSEKLDAIEVAGHLLLAVMCGVGVGAPFASAVYVLAYSVAGTGLALAGAVVAFPVGFVVGLVVYKFREFLRSLSD